MQLCYCFTSETFSLDTIYKQKNNCKTLQKEKQAKNV